MKIIKLKAENIKKLVAVEITPTGNIIKITGKNGAGKTSVLDSIQWALAGGDKIQAQPIRHGEKKGNIEIELDDMIVRRQFHDKTSTLTIENKDGVRLKSPQALLDSLLGRLSFDPLAFMRMKPAEQFSTLRELTGVDLSDLDAQRQKLYDERTDVNRDVKQLTARMQAIVVPANAPDEETPLTEINAEISDAGEVNQKNALAKEKLNGLIAQGSGLADELTNLNNEIEQLITLRNLKQDTLKDLTHRIEEGRKYCADLKDVDVTELRNKFAETEILNKGAKAKADRKKLHTELKATEKRAEKITDDIEKLDDQKKARITAAKFPLEGLAFGDDVVIYAGMPIDQASSAEQLRVSLAMAMALNPKLHVIRVTDGSLLDSASMAIIEEMAKSADYQVWIEMVDESGKVGIVIEDGHIAAVNAEPETKE